MTVEDARYLKQGAIIITLGCYDLPDGTPLIFDSFDEEHQVFVCFDDAGDEHCFCAFDASGDIVTTIPWTMES